MTRATLPHDQTPEWVKVLLRPSYCLVTITTFHHSGMAKVLEILALRQAASWVSDTVCPRTVTKLLGCTLKYDFKL